MFFSQKENASIQNLLTSQQLIESPSLPTPPTSQRDRVGRRPHPRKDKPWRTGQEGDPPARLGTGTSTSAPILPLPIFKGQNRPSERESESESESDVAWKGCVDSNEVPRPSERKSKNDITS